MRLNRRNFRRDRAAWQSLVRDSAGVPADLFDAMQVSDDELETWRIQMRPQLVALALMFPLTVDWEVRRRHSIDSSRQKEPDLASQVTVRSRGVRYPFGSSSRS